MIEILYTLIATHITIICVTLFLHRGQAHKGIQFHPIISHFMRFWLWLTTGMVTKEWVAIHRKHHRYCEQQGDPHSPHVYGILKVLFGGAFLYASAAKDNEMVNAYGVGTPDDWIERKLYTPYNGLGIFILLVLNVLLFGWYGFLIWGIQMVWIPFWAAGVINGIGHWIGYRNGETKDKSRNIFPLGVLIGGECLHNNHHLDPANPKLSRRWFEFDAGWMYLNILRFFRLAKLRV
jgi:stearoyl-CoA desaturase (delta-9 desaturase)